METTPIASKPWLPPDCARAIAEIESSLALEDRAAVEVRLFDLVEDHERLMDRESLGLNAGTNVMNPRAAALLGRSLGNRPSLGYPGDKYEMGMEYAERIEVLAESLAKRLFGAPYAEIRVPSGAIANLYAFMATCRPGDRILAFSGEMGGHVTHHAAGCAGLYGLEVHPVPYDGARMNVDLDRLRDEARRLRPRLITLAGSLCLFPYPVAEVRAIADEVGALVLYDAAHMAGMIAGKRFQDPLAEGAQIVTMSTYKAFGGPPSGLVLTSDAEIAEKIDKIAFPGMTANFDLGKTAALTLSILDLLEFGEAYAAQCIANAQALGEALADEGVDVHRVKGRGHTESHHLALPAASYGGGQTTAKHLAKARILLCGIGLPLPPVAGDLNGLRLGTQELTRWGLKDSEMQAVARLIARILVRDEAPETLVPEVIGFRKDFQTLHYMR